MQAVDSNVTLQVEDTTGLIATSNVFNVVTGPLDHFDIDHAQPSWPTNRWITGMVRLFRPRIAELIRERDRAAEEWSRQHPDENAYEDRRFEIASMTDISVEAQIEAVAAALEAKDAAGSE